jgi:hypothetical protein
MSRVAATKPKPAQIDPALIPFLDALAAMIAVRVLAEHRARQERRGAA